MIIDLRQPMRNFKGQTIKDGENDITLGAVLAEALATDQTGGKMRLFTLAQKCYTGEKIDASAEDLALMKKALEACTSYGGNVIVIGQALELLEFVA